ncbi:hypothetical protein, partial [Paracoccus marinaquae]
SPGFEAIPPLAASNPGEEIIDKNAEADRLKAGGLYPIHGKSKRQALGPDQSERPGRDARPCSWDIGLLSLRSGNQPAGFLPERIGFPFEA